MNSLLLVFLHIFRLFFLANECLSFLIFALPFYFHILYLCLFKLFFLFGIFYAAFFLSFFISIICFFFLFSPGYILTPSQSSFQVELVQKVIDGINLLISLEKVLERGKSIERLLPKEIQ